MASSNQTSASITIDESHPFFLHHAESPGAILASQPLIRGENYPTWARSMKRALRIKNKFWLIDGFASLTSAMEKIPLVRTYVIYLLGTYVIILCNWLIF